MQILVRIQCLGMHIYNKAKHKFLFSRWEVLHSNSITRRQDFLRSDKTTAPVRLLLASVLLVIGTQSHFLLYARVVIPGNWPIGTLCTVWTGKNRFAVVQISSHVFF
jgi:hypothetical protein